MNNSIRVLLFLTVVAIGLGSASFPASRAEPGSSADPQYDEKGELKRPADFRRWVFVGANLGLQYRKDIPLTAQPEQDRPKGRTFGDFHNIYIRPESYEQYLKTGKFPELTVLVMDDYEAKERDPQNVVSQGLFPGEQRRIEVAVKNSKRPDGSKTDWAYYVFDPPAQLTAKAFADRACYDCHRKHANVDNVWVQFYPILRAREVKRNGPPQVVR